MCYFHWLRKKLPWLFDRTAVQIGGEDRTECWEEGNEADAMISFPKKDASQTHAGKPRPRGGIQIIRYGLVKM